MEQATRMWMKFKENINPANRALSVTVENGNVQRTGAGEALDQEERRGELSISFLVQEGENWMSARV